MALATRSAAELSAVEALILAQAVYELGADWQAVGTTLQRSPLVNRQFTAISCHNMYNSLIAKADLPLTDQNAAVHAPVNLQLAKIHWAERANELRELIAAEETKFKQIAREIKEIQAGEWDDKIRQGITGERKPPEDTTQQEVPETSTPNTTTNGINLSSELSAVPDSSPSNKPADKERTPIPENDSEYRSSSPAQEEQDVSKEEDAANKSTKDNNDDAEIEDASHHSDEESSRPKTRRTTRRRRSSVSSNPPAHQLRTRRKRQASAGPVPEQTASSEAMQAGTSRSPSPTEENRTKRKASYEPTDTQRDNKRHRGDSEPADEDDPGPTGPTTRRRRERPERTEEERVANKRFQNVITYLHLRISQHRNGSIFHNPIKDSSAPDYSSIIKRPMDLKTIKAKIKDGTITNSGEYQRDIFLMFANAMMYNKPGSDIFAMAEQMMLDSEEQINSHRQTETLIRQ